MPRSFVPGEFSLYSLRQGLARAGLQRHNVALWLIMRLRRTHNDAAVLAELLCHPRPAPAGLKLPELALSGLPSVHKWRMMGKVHPQLVRLQTDLGHRGGGQRSVFLHGRQGVQ